MGQKALRRLFKAVVIALTIPLLFGVAAWIVVDVLGGEFPEWIVQTAGVLFGWPLLLLAPFIPASDSPDPHAPFVRTSLYLLAVVLDVAVYSLLIYFVLGLFEKRRAIAERRV